MSELGYTEYRSPIWRRYARPIRECAVGLLCIDAVMIAGALFMKTAGPASKPNEINKTPEISGQPFCDTASIDPVRGLAMAVMTVRQAETPISRRQATATAEAALYSGFCYQFNDLRSGSVGTPTCKIISEAATPTPTYLETCTAPLNELTLNT